MHEQTGCLPPSYPEELQYIYIHIYKYVYMEISHLLLNDKLSSTCLQVFCAHLLHVLREVCLYVLCLNMSYARNLARLICVFQSMFVYACQPVLRAGVSMRDVQFTTTNLLASL